jgi:hypothetical protein
VKQPEPFQVAQPGMTAWGRAAERDLEAYARSTSVNAPDDLTERVMTSIARSAAGQAAGRRRWFSVPLLARVQAAAGSAAVILALTIGGVLALAGAAAFTRPETPPRIPFPDDRPIVIVQPTPTLDIDVDASEATPEPRVSVQTPSPPDPDRPRAVEGPGRPGTGDATPPKARDGTDEPEATDDDDNDHGGHDGDGASETDEPEDGGSSGGSGDGGG